MTIDLDDLKRSRLAQRSTVTEPAGLESLIDYAKARIFRGRVLMIAELLMTAALLAVLGQMIVSSPSWFSQSVFALFGVVLVAVEAGILRHRRLLEQSPAMSAREYGNYLVGVARMNLRFAWFGLFGAQAGVIMGYVAMCLHVGASPIAPARVALAVIAIAACFVVSWFLLQRRKRQLKKAIGIAAGLN